MPYFFVLPAGVKSVLANYFRDKPKGTIIECGSLVSGVPVEASATGSYALRNSYIKLNKDVYVLGQGKEAIVGSGFFGTVKYVQSFSTNAIYVAKVQHFKSCKSEIERVDNEINALYDLGLYRDAGSITEAASITHYIVMADVGVSLDKYLKKHPALSTKVRFDLAIKLNWAMHNLHRGAASRTNTTYAHRDIKPPNIVITPTYQIQLIDVGLCNNRLDSLPKELAGAPAYVPDMRTFLTTVLSLRQLDVLALKRVIFMPDKMLCNLGYKEDTTGKHFNLPAIFSRALLNDSGLLSYFDTSVTDTNQATISRENFQGDPLVFASLLVLGRYGLVGRYAQKVIKNQTLAYAVLGMYFANQDKSDPFVAAQISYGINAYVLCRIVSRYRPIAERITLLGLLVKAGITNDLNQAIDNKTLIGLIKDPSPEVRKAAVLLWQNGLGQLTFLDQLTRNVPLAKKVIQLVFDGDLIGVNKLLLPRAAFNSQKFFLAPVSVSAVSGHPSSTPRDRLKENGKDKPVAVGAQSTVKFPPVFFGGAKTNPNQIPKKDGVSNHDRSALAHF